MNGNLPLGTILDVEKKPILNKVIVLFFILGLIVGFVIGMVIFKSRPPSIVPYNFPPNQSLFPLQ